MPKAFKPAVLTANDLVDGVSVFLTPEGWSTSVTEAMVAISPEQAEELTAQGERAVQANEVVLPYLVAVGLETGAPVPLARREQIRASGAPTIPVGLAA